MTTPPAPDPTPPPAPAAPEGPPLAERVAGLERGQQTILERLQQLVTGGGAPPRPAAENHAVSVADEIRRQLAERAPAAPAAPAAAAAPEPEKPPAAPVRKLTSKLWGSD